MAISIIDNKNSTRNHPTGVNFLLANITQEITSSVTFVMDFDFLSNAQNVVQFIALNQIELLSGQLWNNLGFKIGDSIALTGTINNGSPNITFTALARTISDIQGNILTVSVNFDSDINLLNQLMPFNFGVAADSNTQLAIVNTTVISPQTIEIFHNLIENSQPNTALSLFDGEVNRFVVDGVNSMIVTDVLPMEQLGNKSGGTYTSATLERLADVSGNVCYKAEFKHFMPCQFEDTDFVEPSYVESPLSLKNYYKILGLPQTNNPNAQLLTQWSAQLGNAGWYNENYNQGINEFTIDSYVITDNLGVVLTEIDPNQENNIVATISGPSNFLETAEIEFYCIPEISTVKNKPDTHSDLIYLSNSFIDSVPVITNQVFGVGGAYMAIASQVLDVAVANKITISFKLQPNDPFKLIGEGLLYRIAVNVESTGGTVNDNNAVALILDEGTLTKAAIDGGVYDAVSFQGFYNHSQVAPSGTSETVFTGCTEDDMLWVSRFTFKKLAEWKRLTLNIQVVKNSTGEYFNLFERLINLESYVMNIDGIIQVNYSESLPQFLESTGRNQLTVGLTGITTSTTYEIQINWSLMADWRYWNAQSNGSLVDFFDAALPNNGQNAEWMRYLREAGYSIRLKATVKDSEDTDFHWATQINLQDYDDTLEVTTAHEYYDSSDVLQTSLIQGELMRIKAIHTLASGSWPTLDSWGWISARPKENEQNKRISTVWDWTSQNLPLKPLAGEAKAKLTFPTPDVAVVECLIDTNYVNVDTTTIISRIETPSAPVCVSPINWIFDQMISLSANDSEYSKVLFNLLFSTQDVTDFNVCCPNCEMLVGDDSYYIYAFGKKTLINGIISFFGTPCCYDELGGVSDCEVGYDTIYGDLEAACTGPSFGGDLPSQINTFTNNDLQTISDRIIGCTTNTVIRHNLLSILVNFGIKIICDSQTGRKIISKI